MATKYGILIAAVSVQLSLAQTQVSLRNQARDVDFSSVPSTKPAQTGTTLPATCSAGAVFISLSNPAGQNVYVCTGANSWSLQSGGLVPNTLAASASGHTLSAGPNCTPVLPCNVRLGGTVFAFTNGVTATLSNDSGTAYVYVSSSGLLTVGSDMNISCSGGCIAATGISGFPSDCYPIAVWTASNGVWSPVGIDTRAFLGRDLVNAGPGLTETLAGAGTTLSSPPQVGGFAVAFRGADIAAGSTLYLTIPYSCTITDWAITADDTATIRLWRVNDGGTELPNDGDVLSSAGFSLATGRRIHSTVLTDLSSTSIFAFDTIGVNLFADGPSTSHVEFYLGCTR